MNSKITGIVIRTRPLGDNDLLLTVLTGRLGKIDCVARGVRKSKKSPLYANLFAYSDFSLYRGRTFYRIESADLKESFYGLRQSLEGLYLGQYFAEAAGSLPPGSAAGDEDKILRLLCNSLFLLCKKPSAEEMLKIKIVFEVKFAQISGLFPDHTACAGCGRGPLVLWDFSSGFFCAACGAVRRGRPVSETVMKVFGHILSVPQSAAYSFAVTKELLEYISRMTGDYLSSVLDAEFHALDSFYDLNVSGSGTAINP